MYFLITFAVALHIKVFRLNLTITTGLLPSFTVRTWGSQDIAGIPGESIAFNINYPTEQGSALGQSERSLWSVLIRFIPYLTAILCFVLVSLRPRIFRSHFPSGSQFPLTFSMPHCPQSLIPSTIQWNWLLPLNYSILFGILLRAKAMYTKD